MTDKSRVVFVTGSARGIGFAIAEAFIQNGDQPIIQRQSIIIPPQPDPF
jgi:NAD(P)-dependent dehydrogenase (short-subunit alcohol dehydrogenase family)